MSQEIVAEFAKLYEEDPYALDCFDDVEIVECGEWEQDYKYQSRCVVVRYKDIHIQVNEGRSGSYHSDWYYTPSTIFQVAPVAKVVTVFEYNIVGDSIEIDRD